MRRTMMASVLVLIASHSYAADIPQGATNLACTGNPKPVQAISQPIKTAQGDMVAVLTWKPGKQEWSSAPKLVPAESVKPLPTK